MGLIWDKFSWNIKWGTGYLSDLTLKNKTTNDETWVQNIEICKYNLKNFPTKQNPLKYHWYCFALYYKIWFIFKSISLCLKNYFHWIFWTHWRWENKLWSHRFRFKDLWELISKMWKVWKSKAIENTNDTGSG